MDTFHIKFIETPLEEENSIQIKIKEEPLEEPEEEQPYYELNDNNTQR